MSLEDDRPRAGSAAPTISLDGWVRLGRQVHRRAAGLPHAESAEKDASGQTRYQIEFDPPSNPEMATGAEIIGTAFYHAFGYHTVEVYLAELDPATDRRSRRTARIYDPLIGEQAVADAARRRRRPAARRAAAERQVPRAREPLRRGPAARQLPLLRHAARRPERHRAARAPPRAARRARVRRLAEPRRLARREQPRLPRRRGRRASTSSTTCSTSARSWAAARCSRSAIAPATSTSSSRSRAG